MLIDSNSGESCLLAGKGDVLSLWRTLCSGFRDGWGFLLKDLKKGRIATCRKQPLNFSNCSRSEGFARKWGCSSDVSTQSWLLFSKLLSSINKSSANLANLVPTLSLSLSSLPLMGNAKFNVTYDMFPCFQPYLSSINNHNCSRRESLQVFLHNSPLQMIGYSQAPV